MAGFITLQRKVREHPLFRGKPERLGAWTWLLLSACWKPTKVRIKGETVELQRGELSFSQRFLAEAWGWSKSRVDRFIAELRDEGMIETRAKNGATAGHSAGQGQAIITICNYDKYQDKAERLRGNDKAENGATAGQQRGKEEQGNNILPLPNGNGADPEKVFWDSAKAYLGPSKSSMIGRWVSKHGREKTGQAITAAQLERAVDPVPYIEAVLRKTKTSAGEVW